MTPVTVVCGVAAVAQINAEMGEGAMIATVGATLPAGPWVLWLDGLSQSERAQLEKALLAVEQRPIAVFGDRWDGFTPLPLVALCRGVISGFGVAGLRAALGALEREGQAG